MLQSQLGLKAIEAELVTDRGLISREIRQFVACGAWLLAPERAVGYWPLAIHEERCRVRKMAAELVEDGKAVSASCVGDIGHALW
ncbi:hypothetical protein C7S18_14645 [Ahniella affigens]|uniref:Uncharacterized protein n=1 Tax=Ahniella affigens TaxID=2021234 RepID=A0A2P1PU44_9GAMM|nr:hypothetical protein C7S18_14645 [Ahniella affigens]